MKLKKSSLIGLLLVTGFLAQAQSNVNVSFSQPIKASKQAVILNSGQVNDNIYVIKLEKKEYSMLIYDANLKFQKEVMFKPKNCKGDDCIDDRLSYKRSLFLKDRILIFFEIFEKDTQNRLLFCQAFSLKGDFIGKLTQVDNIPAEKKSNSGNFLIEYSRDKTKFVVIQVPAYEKNEEKKYGFKVYDASLKNLANTTVALPYLQKNTTVRNYFLSNRGDVYMLLKVKYEKDQKQRGEDDEFFSILSLNTSGDNSLSEYKIQLPQKNIVSVDLQLNDETETVACAGLYANIKTTVKATKDISGVFYVNVDMKTGKMLSQSYKELDKDMVARLLGKKEGAKVKEDKGIQSTFSIEDFAKLPDGSAYLIAENSFINAITTCGKYGCVTRYEYHYRNVLAIGISPKGEIQSLTDIPKRQIGSSVTRVFMKHLMMQKDNRVFILYNDDPKNMSADAKTVRDVKPFSKVNNGALILAELLPNGSYSKTQIFSNKERQVVAQPRDGFRLEDGKYIVPLKIKGTDFGFIRLDIK